MIIFLHKFVNCYNSNKKKKENSFGLRHVQRIKSITNYIFKLSSIRIEKILLQGDHVASSRSVEKTYRSSTTTWTPKSSVFHFSVVNSRDKIEDDKEVSLPPIQLTVIIHEHANNLTCSRQWLYKEFAPVRVKKLSSEWPALVVLSPRQLPTYEGMSSRRSHLALWSWFIPLPSCYHVVTK